jgi:hypothetical protein
METMVRVSLNLYYQVYEGKSSLQRSCDYRYCIYVFLIISQGNLYSWVNFFSIS